MQEYLGVWWLDSILCDSVMGKFHDTASFHRHLKKSELFTKQLKYSNGKRNHYNLPTRKVKETSIVQIRNKFTKEIVDFDVSYALSHLIFRFIRILILYFFREIILYLRNEGVLCSVR
jgi:hypothetical protein